MRISHLIALLHSSLQEFGDVDIAVVTDTPDGLFHVDLEPAACVIGIPVDEYNDKLQTVLAIGWEECLAVPEEEPGEIPDNVRELKN